jgi:hypothetical protein
LFKRFYLGPSRIVGAAEPDKINVCYSSIAATSITTWVPERPGSTRSGLDVSIIYVAGAKAITTLISATPSYKARRRRLSRAYPARI